MKLVKRDKCVIDGNNELELLHVFKDFPIYMGCVETNADNDIFFDMNWYISKNGCIQLNPLVPIETLYKNSHSESIGEVFNNLHKEFAKFIEKYNHKKIFEIGGAHGKLSKEYAELIDDPEWTILEPDPNPVNGVNAKIIKGFFGPSFNLEWNYDVVVHSHVYEHIYQPEEFMKIMASFIPTGFMQIFAIPNMIPQLENKFLSCLDPEHTVLLTENNVEYMLTRHGFKILEKKYYLKDHSIFYAVEKISTSKPIKLINEYYENKELFNSYINHYISEVVRINKVINETENPVYLFGAHLFSQYLIAFGLNISHIKGVLDNSKIKNKKRLYGTSFFVDSPIVLKDIKTPVVILKAGMYNDEIMNDILANINPKTKFIL
jgi:hypothetical protein